MVLLRLVMTGLCAASVVLLATVQPLRIEVTRPTAIRDRSSLVSERSALVSVVDVASRVAPGEIAALLHLRADERVSAINDRVLDDDMRVDDLIAALTPTSGGYLDLTVSSETHERRVLVLMH